MRYIVPLSVITSDSVSDVGGKAANLGELTKANFPVPEGFVISTQAYLEYIHANKLESKITANKNSIEEIHTFFLDFPIPKNIESEIISSYQKLNAKSVAIRSSAITEDQPNAAFAGQQETYLNIVNEKQLIEAVRKTWKSLWSPHVIEYRKFHQIAEDNLAIAVIVQIMVDADYAGVMFTANPITNSRSQIIIDSTPGLGESLVSGSTTPNHYVLESNKANYTIIERSLAHSSNVAKLKQDGGIVYERNQSTSEALSDRQITELAHFGTKIQKHFGIPQDIEWAIIRDEVFILQSRPITTLEEPIKKPTRFDRMLAGIIVEVMPERPKPLEATLVAPKVLVDHAAKKLANSLGINLPSSKKLFAEENGVITSYVGGFKPTPTLKLLLLPLKLIQLSLRYDPYKWQEDQDLKKLNKLIVNTEAADLSKYSNRELSKTLEDLSETLPTVFDVRLKYLPKVVFSLLLITVLLKLARKQDQLSTLIFVGLETEVTKTNRKLVELAEQVKNSPTVLEAFIEVNADEIEQRLSQLNDGKVFLEAVTSFLNEHGYRETSGTTQLSKPTWKEAPETFFEVLKSMVTTDHPNEVQVSWKSVRDEILSTSLLKYWPLKTLFLNTLPLARMSHPLREDTRYYVMKSFPAHRKVILEIASRLIKQETISTANDIYFLKFEEVKKLINIPQETSNQNWVKRIEGRSEFYNSLKSKPMVPHTFYQRKNDDNSAFVSGIPGSPGSASGVARVIMTMEDFSELKEGEILIAPYTTPAWTPLFQKAAGVVVDTGSVVSHAAIVAREYGIPAVMSTVNGTKKIKNGQTIRIDGNAGTVNT